jgi:VanZ family protein
MRRLFQILAWLLLAAIVAVSIVPPELRLATDFPQPLEHFSVFLLVGFAFCLGYPSRYTAQGVALVLFAAAVELLQLWIPGRHARIGDFLLAALGVGIGIGSKYLWAIVEKDR